MTIENAKIMTTKNSKYLIFPFSFVFHVLSFFQFELKFPTLGLPIEWFTHFLLLLGISFSLSLVLPFVRRRLLILMLVVLHLLIILIAGYPLQDYLGIEYSLLLLLVLEVSLLLPFSLGCICSSLFITTAVVCQLPIIFLGRSAFDRTITGADTIDFFSLGLYLFVWMAILFLLKKQINEISNKSELVDTLHESIRQLTSANVSYQDYAQSVEEHSTALERKRIAREIHEMIAKVIKWR